MKRREFITLLGGATAAWPLAVSAQSSMPVVGFLNSLSSAETSHVVGAFRQGVAQAGLVGGKSLRFEYLYADGVYQRLPGMAAEFVRRNVAVIAAGAPPAALAAKAAGSGLLLVDAAPASALHLLAAEERARPSGGGRLASIVCAVAARLAGRVVRILGLVDRGRF